MAKIKLSDDMEIIVDDEDEKYILRFKWTIHKGNIFREFNIDKKTILIPLWKFIIASENNKSIIFNNRNNLDYRKENLRLAPIYVARHKAMKKSHNNNKTPSSEYKGVSYASTYAGKKKWIADIVCQGKRYGGHFMTEKEAAVFYNEKAIEFYGENSYQNIIKE